MRKRASVQETIVTEAAAELHAAALAVILHLGHTEVREAVEAYRARVLSRHHTVPHILEEIEAYLVDIDHRASRQADELEKGLYAKRLERIGRRGASQSISVDAEEVLEESNTSLYSL